MQNIGEFLGLIVLICAGVILAIFLASLPFAFLGWLIMAFSNIFGAGIAITYSSSAIVGLVSALFIALFAK